MKPRSSSASRPGGFIPVTLAVLLLASGGRAQPTNFAHSLPDLRTQLDGHLNQPRFNGAIWGVKVVSLDTGKTVYEHHPDRLMSPASNSKLYAAALALDTLGGDYRFATPLLTTGKIGRNGILHGDLIVSGRGDPSWKSTNFSDVFAPFIAVLTNAGVRGITGDLVADTTFLKTPPTGASWCVEDLDDSEGGEICALSLADNLAQVRISPATNAADACSLSLPPPETGIVLVNRTRTVPAGGQGHLELYRPPGSKTYCLFGELPADAAAQTVDLPVPQPAAWFGAALKAALGQNGIAINGKVRCLAWPEVPPWPEANLVKLGEVQSPPLRDILRAFLKPSQNLETDLVFDHTGECFRRTNSPAWMTSEDLAVSALEKFLASNGIPADVHFDEGSGLSRNNLTSANATVALLTMMRTNRWAGDFMDGLPVAGVDGTLRARMKGTPAFKNVRAKTGTLRWVNSLSGYVTTAAGERLAFSLMLNRYAPPAGRKRTAELDDLAVLLAGFSGRSDE